jgi:putative phosphoribosyl transferase
MGSTMRAAIMLCKNRRAKKIVVAVPVSGEEVAQEIEKMVDALVVLEKPEFFRVVAHVYRNWHDCSYEEVVGIMEKLRDEKAAQANKRKV